jgi:beta-lactamase class A
VSRKSTTQSNGAHHKLIDHPLTLAVLGLILILVLFGVGRSISDRHDSDASTTSLSSPSFTASRTQTTTSLQATPSITSESTTSTPEPTAAPTLSHEERKTLIEKTGEQVIEYLEEITPARFGVFFMALHGGETWTYHANDPFVAASSIKIVINTLLYERIESGKISPDSILTYDNRSYPTGDYEAGTGTIQQLPNGSELTVRETSGLSIRISDNCGTNMIIRRLGGIDAINPEFNAISGVIDYRKPVAYTNYAGQAQSGRHRTCAQDLGMHAVYLYEHWKQNPSVYDPLLDDLCHTQFDFGIHKGIPEDVAVAHKIGTNGIYSAENDVGIVWTEEPFVLCVMTEMADPVRARSVQADIASLFYQCVSGWPYR